MKEKQTGHHRGNSTEPLLNKDIILNALDILPGQIIVDVGCGNGYMAKEFSRLLNNTGKVYALDRADEAIEQLKREAEGTNIVPIEADITQRIALQDASIDLIYLSTVFHIFSDGQRKNFQNEVKRILKPKGRVAIVEIEKRETPFGPPQNMKVSPEELRQFFKMQPASLLKVGEHFYMQLFENNTSDSFDFTPPQSPRKRGEAHMRHPFSHFPPFTGG
ncbi:MAG: class I SAM-dependent methyltransferase [Candidatus Vecturithrix sp.]|jgi:ubiquinone/menaquinone biosynthesis C-methylase UbiE|nr:class I SAM-dependent methyltransferase [Candidatus Vecturithrix sp.]